MNVTYNSLNLASKLLIPNPPCTEISLSCCVNNTIRTALSTIHTVGILPFLGVNPSLNSKTVIKITGQFLLNFLYPPYLIGGVTGAMLHGKGLLSALSKAPRLRTPTDPQSALNRGERRGIERSSQPIGKRLWDAVSANCNNGSAKSELWNALAGLSANQLERLGNGAATPIEIKALFNTNDVGARAIKTAFTSAKATLGATDWPTLINAWRGLDEQKENNEITAAALRLARSPEDVIGQGRRYQVFTQLFWTTAHLLSGISTAMYQIAVQSQTHLKAELVGDASSEVLKQCAEQGGLAWVLNAPGLSLLTYATTHSIGYAVSWLPILIFAKSEYQSISHGQLNPLAQIKQRSFWAALLQRTHWYAIAAISYQVHGTQWLSASIGSTIQYTGLWSHLQASEVGAWVATATLIGIAVREIFSAKNPMSSLMTVGRLIGLFNVGRMTQMAGPGFEWLARSVTHGWYCTMAEAAFA